MKAALFSIVMFAGSMAFAGYNCQSVFVGTGEAGQGYYVDSCSHPTYRGCVEGEIGSFPTGQYGSEGGPVEVTRVCHNGTFFPHAKPVHHRGCIEGEITSIPTNIYTAEGGAYEARAVCHNGKFVRTN